LLPYTKHHSRSTTYVYPLHLEANLTDLLLQIFDKVAVLYEGRQIYFGGIQAAKEYFISMGFECPLRQTAADFLTSITSPAERIVREGFVGRTPLTPDEFAAAWQKSDDRAQLLQDIDEVDRLYPIGGEHLEKFRESRRGKHPCLLIFPYCADSPMQPLKRSHSEPLDLLPVRLSPY
jgi:ATP-binding cassette subfamily G (WHITE) protein 2 (PDR)